MVAGLLIGIGLPILGLGPQPIPTDDPTGLEPSDSTGVADAFQPGVDPAPAIGPITDQSTIIAPTAIDLASAEPVRPLRYHSQTSRPLSTTTGQAIRQARSRIDILRTTFASRRSWQ